MARKPLIGTVAQNVEKHGTGGLNINGCRVGHESTIREKAAGGNQFPHEDDAWKPRAVTVGSDLGRWPANLAHDGSDDVLSCFPDAVGQIADASSSSSRKTQNTYGDMKRGNEADSQIARLDAGSAARFFYCAKASRADRNDGCEALAKKPLHWSSGDQNPGSFQAEGTDKTAHNNHPTVKPTELMRWLVRLVTPAGGVVLDPFMGSGSTGRAAMLEGMRFVGIELNPDYLQIAEARIGAVSRQGSLL